MRIQIRRDNALDWSTVNPVLAEGEWGLDSTIGQVKIGDGVTPWNTLDYYAPGGGGGIDQIISLISGTEFWAKVTIVDDGTATSGWPNRLEFEYKPDPDTTVGQHLTGWFNEYGEGRFTPAKDNTVPLRVFTKEQDDDPEHDSGTPVFEVVWSRPVRDMRFAVYHDGRVESSGGFTHVVEGGPTISTGYLHLDAADPIPTGTPAGIMIVRT